MVINMRAFTWILCLISLSLSANAHVYLRNATAETIKVRYTLANGFSGETSMREGSDVLGSTTFEVSNGATAKTTLVNSLDEVVWQGETTDHRVYVVYQTNGKYSVLPAGYGRENRLDYPAYAVVLNISGQALDFGLFNHNGTDGKGGYQIAGGLDPNNKVKLPAGSEFYLHFSDGTKTENTISPGNVYLLFKGPKKLAVEKVGRTLPPKAP